MNRGFVVLGLTLACATMVSARPPQQQARPWAEEMFGPAANRVHDFGTVRRGVLLYHDFVLTNVSAMPVEIIRVKAGGCLDAWLPGQWALPPKSKAAVRVRMDTRRFAGKKTASIVVTVGRRDLAARLIEIREVRLTLKAVSRAD